MGWQDSPPVDQPSPTTPKWMTSPAAPKTPLAYRVEEQESKHNPNAVNPKSGAEGSMQTLPSTLHDPGYGVTPAKDNSPEEMTRVGKDYLAALQKKYGNDAHALAAYNWGPGHVDALLKTAKTPEEFNAGLPRETQDYIAKITGNTTQPKWMTSPAAPKTPPASPASPAPPQVPVAPAPTGGIKETLAGLEEPAIKGAANIESRIIAPFLSPEQRQKLQAKGLYDPNALPASGYGAAITGPIGTAVMTPIMNTVSAGAEKAGKSLGLSDKTRSNVGSATNAVMDSLAVAGLPEAAKVGAAARGIEGTSLPVSQRTPLSVETKMRDLELKHDASASPKQKGKLEKQMDTLLQQHPETTNHEFDMAKNTGTRPKWAGSPPVKAPPAPTEESKIFTPDEGVASTKPLASTGGIADRLYAEKNRGAVDQAELMKWMQQFQGVPKETWEKFTEHMDDPKNVPLTPQEKTLYDNSIGAIEKEREAARKTITSAGYKPEELVEEPVAEESERGGATRQVIGKGTPMDRLLGIKPGAAVGKRSLSKLAGSNNPRSMKSMVDSNGNRTIVHVKDNGEIVDARDTSKVVGDMKDNPKLEQATQKEIEAATGNRIQYHKNSLGVQVTSLLQERRAARNIKLLKELPKSSGALDVMRVPGTKGKNIPKGWVEIPNLPALRGYHFAPEFAEEIQDHLNAAIPKQGLMKALETTNNIMRSAFFWLNPAHAYNVAEAFAVTKGATGFAKDLPAAASDFVKSLKSVVTRDKMYLKSARAGVPYRGLDSMTDKFNKSLLAVMGERARQDPATFTEFAKQFGFNQANDLIKRVAQISHDVPFGLQDILQQTLERGMERKGIGQAEATEQIAKTLPNYRTKARYFNNRLLGQAAKGSAFLQFPGWDIGRLSGMAHMLSNAAKLNPKALDQLLMVAVLYEFGTKIIDPLVRQATGNPNAEGPTAGYGALVRAGKDIGTGEKTPYQALLSLFPEGYIPRFVGAGTNIYTGQQTSLPGETALETAYDYGKKVTDELDPLRRLANIVSGKSSIPEEAWRQIGVKSPSEEETNSKERSKKYIERELKSKRRKEPDWIRP
jgi:hypothetical protein